MSMTFMSIRELCEAEEIDLRGEDGQPYCCDERMHVKSGICGPDFARCRQCGKEIRNFVSPHVNGGYLVTEEFAESGRTWARVQGKEVTA